MIAIIDEIFERIICEEGEITFQEALYLAEHELDYEKKALSHLFDKADQLRKKFHGDSFDLCTIVNAKSGNCSEDCTYCAQSSHYNTGIPTYNLMDVDEISELAQEAEENLIDKFSLVTSGKGLEDAEEIEELKKLYETLGRETSLHLCASHGIISYETAKALKKSGVQMYHHNLETSREFYGEICTTHSYHERIECCKNAKRSGMKLCSGGIFGLGESMKDRINMAFELKELQADSVPINILMPIQGTPLALKQKDPISPEEIIRTIALYRFILPKAVIRYAGGRQLLEKFERRSLSAGINGLLTGNYLTTTGSTVKRDREMAEEAGFELRK